MAAVKSVTPVKWPPGQRLAVDAGEEHLLIKQV
jgi:hypothetical protein